MSSLTKIERFLISIGIDNTEDFDMDFEYVARNQILREQVDMVIIKDTPWEYRYLDQLMNGLTTIQYKYTLKFKYKSEITPLDVYDLFANWQHTKAFFSVNLKHEEDAYGLHFVADNEDQKIKYEDLIDEFKEFLSFLNYQVDVDIIVNEEESSEPVQVEPVEVVEEIPEVKEAHSSKESSNEEEEEVEEKEEEQPVQEEKKDGMSDFERAFLDAQIANLQAMENERKNKELWKKGGYQPFEDLSLINPESGNVDFDGEVFAVGDARKTKKGSTFRTFCIW